MREPIYSNDNHGTYPRGENAKIVIKIFYLIYGFLFTITVTGRLRQLPALIKYATTTGEKNNNSKGSRRDGLFISLTDWTAPSEKAPSSMRKMLTFGSPCACAKYRPGCSLFIHFEISYNSVSGE